MACAKRNELKYMLQEAASNKALTVSPDNWTDNHRRICYMGATAHFVDENLTYQSIDLFCVEFREAKKTAENIYEVLLNHIIDTEKTMKFPDDFVFFHSCIFVFFSILFVLVSV